MWFVNKENADVELVNLDFYKSIIIHQVGLDECQVIAKNDDLSYCILFGTEPVSYEVARRILQIICNAMMENKQVVELVNAEQEIEENDDEERFEDFRVSTGTF